MARLAGVDLPREKRMEIALTYIYGIGKTHAKETLAATGVSPDLRAKDLSDEDLLKLRAPARARARPSRARRRPADPQHVGVRSQLPVRAGVTVRHVCCLAAATPGHSN